MWNTLIQRRHHHHRSISFVFLHYCHFFALSLCGIHQHQLAHKFLNISYIWIEYTGPPELRHSREKNFYFCFAT